MIQKNYSFLFAWYSRLHQNERSRKLVHTQWSASLMGHITAYEHTRTPSGLQFNIAIHGELPTKKLSHRTHADSLQRLDKLLDLIPLIVRNVVRFLNNLFNYQGKLVLKMIQKAPINAIHSFQQFAREAFEPDN